MVEKKLRHEYSLMYSISPSVSAGLGEDGFWRIESSGRGGDLEQWR